MAQPHSKAIAAHTRQDDRLPLRALAVTLLAAGACAQAGVEPVPGAGGGSNGGANNGGGGSGEFTLNKDGGVGTGTGGGPSAGGGSGGGIEGEMGCNRLDVKWEKQTPTVVLLIDRSSSMYDAYPGATNRWVAVKSALLDGQAGLIKANEAEVRFGLVTYTGLAPAPTCPVLEKIDIAMGNFDKINTVFGAAEPPRDMGNLNKGETPTGEALAAVTAQLEAFGESGPKHIVLATDGEPDTCPGTCTGNCSVADRSGWPRDPNCGQDRSISTVQAAFAKGIKTYVIGLGNDVGADHLQSLANAGAGLPVALGEKQANWLQYSCNLPPSAWKGVYVPTTTMNAKYFKPADAASLAADLKTILGGVRSCTYKLNGKVNVTQAAQGKVLLNGKALTYNDANGWRMNTETDLEILGSACVDLQAAGQSLSVSFPCGIFKVIE